MQTRVCEDQLEGYGLVIATLLPQRAGSCQRDISDPVKYGNGQDIICCKPAVKSVRAVLGLLTVTLLAALLVLVPGVFAPAQAGSGPDQAAPVSAQAGSGPVLAASENVNSTVDIVAEIQPDGSAIITDTRTFKASSGTEYYLSWGNLGDSQVINTNVVLDGEPLKDVGEWDVDRTRSEKAGQFGMREVGDQVELAFGFGTYLEHTAVMTYQITNFVKNLQDGAQAIYWQFVPRKTTDIQRLSVSLINAQGFTFTQENSRVWAFGFEGTSDISGAEMTMTSSLPMNADNYAVMLAVWPDAPFQTSSNMTETTETLIERAFSGSDFRAGGPIEWLKNSSWGQRLWLVGITALVGLLGVTGTLWAVRKIYQWSHSAQVKNNAKAHRFKATVGSDFYWREIPYDGSAFEVCSMVGSVVPGTVDAMVLTWLLDDHVRVVQTDKGGLFPREVTGLKFDVDNPPTMLKLTERDLWEMFVEASGSDHVLVPDDFKKWVKQHSGRLRGWMASAKLRSEELMEERGLMKWDTRQVLRDFVTVLKVTPDGQELVNRCAGFKNFIQEFSLLTEREPVNVKLWDSYMIWAAMLGVADEARKQFGRIYPGYEQESVVIPAAGVVNLIVASAVSSVASTSASVRAGVKAGAGGIASVGGGGGSFGGGSGGGVR